MLTEYTYGNRKAWRKQASANRKAKRLAFTLKITLSIALAAGLGWYGMGYLLSVAPIG